MGKTPKKTLEQAQLEELFLGIESGTLVSESPHELLAIKRARGEETKPVILTNGTPAQTQEKETAKLPYRAPREASGKIRAGRLQPASSSVSIWEKCREAKNLVLVPLLIVGLIGVGTYYLTSGSTEVKSKPSQKSSVQAEPEVKVAPAPGPTVTPAPQPKASGSPAPAPLPTPRPTPQPKASSNPAPSSPAPPAGTGVPTPSLRNPAPLAAPTPEPKAKVVAPATEETFDRTDSTPGGETQRDSKISDAEHGGDPGLNDGLGDRTYEDDPPVFEF